MAVAVIPRLQMADTFTRLATYSEFPVTNVFVSKLSNAGLFSTGSGKEVQCWECSFACADWNSMDDLFSKHSSYNSSCQSSKQFTGRNSDATEKKPESSRILNAGSTAASRDNNYVENSNLTNLQNPNTGNHYQPKNESQFSQPKENNISNVRRSNVPQSPTQQHRESLTNAEKRQTLNGLGISTAKPKYSRYVLLATRESTFQNWPSHLKQDRHEMASAGFFCPGEGGLVRCFFCGGGLTDWEEEDDPWVEHAHWFPDCVHLNNCKGREFVQRIQEIAIEQDGEPETHSMNSSLQTESHETFSQKPELCSRTVDPLDTIAVQSILSIGYDIDTVKKAVEVWTERKHNQSFTANELIEIVFEIEEGEYNNESGVRFSQTEKVDVISSSNVSTQDNPSGHNLNSSADDSKCEQQHPQPKNKKVMGEMIEENNQLKERIRCKICMDENASVVFLPCSHLATCSACAPAMRLCPICRSSIKSTIRTYMA